MQKTNSGCMERHSRVSPNVPAFEFVEVVVEVVPEGDLLAMGVSVLRKHC